jgi:hypothetical protein
MGLNPMMGVLTRKRDLDIDIQGEGCEDRGTD